MSEQSTEQSDAQVTPDKSRDSVPTRDGGAPSSGGGKSPWTAIALLIALGAAGLSAWQYWQGLQTGAQPSTADLREDAQARESRLNQELTALSDQVDGLAEDVSSLRTLTEAVQQSQEQIGRDADQARQAEAERSAALESALAGLEQRQASLEGRLAEIAGSESSARQQLRLAEADWLLGLAQQRLALGGEVRPAARALELAQEQLAALDDPRLAAVRRTLAADLQALTSHPQVDVPALAGRLLAVEESVTDWPLREDLLPSESEPIADTVSDTQSEGFLEGVGAVLGKLVVVRRDPRTDTPVLAPDELRWLRENTRREVTLARMALLAGETTVVRESLERVRTWAERYFDADTEAMGEALSRIDEVLVGLSDEAPPMPRAREELRNMMALDGAGS